MFRTWGLMLLAIAATLALAMPAVRYAELSLLVPSAADETVRRLGEPVLAEVPGGFLLTAADPAKSHGLAWPLPLAPEAVAMRVQAEVALDGVSEGEKTWHRAMLSVRMLDEHGKGHERAAFAGSGTQTASVDTVILLLPDAAETQLMARLLRVSGAMTLSDLRVSWLAERNWVPPAMLALWMVWLLAFGNLLVHWLHAARHRLVLVLVFAGVLGAVVMPGEWRDILQLHVTTAVHGWLADWLGWTVPVADGRGLSDYVHFLMFALLGMALVLARPGLATWRLIGGLILLGAATEVVQLLVPGREGGWQDVALDAAGAMLGVLLARAIQRTHAALPMTARGWVSPK